MFWRIRKLQELLLNIQLDQARNKFISFCRNLGKNSIETLDEDSLQRLNILEDLDLRGNPLKSFHINAFAGLSNLKKL